MKRLKLTLLAVCISVASFGTLPSKGFDSIESLYKESVEVIKSKDRQKIREFIEKIIPDKGTIAYMNKRKCEYRRIPRVINQSPQLLDSVKAHYTEKLYNYSLKLERMNTLEDLKFEGFERELMPEKLDECGCPEILFEEIFVKCSSKETTIKFSFGEILKVNGKWKSFTNFKLW